LSGEIYGKILDYAGGKLYLRPNSYFDEPFERVKGDTSDVPDDIDSE